MFDFSMKGTKNIRKGKFNFIHLGTIEVHRCERRRVESGEEDLPGLMDTFGRPYHVSGMLQTYRQRSIKNERHLKIMSSLSGTQD